MDNIYVIIWIAIYTSMKVLGLLEKLLCTYSCCPITTSFVHRTSGLWSFSSTSSNGKVGKICSVLPPLYLLTLNFHVKFWLTIICVCEWFYILLAFCGGKVWYLFLLNTIYPLIVEGIIYVCLFYAVVVKVGTYNELMISKHYITYLLQTMMAY